MKYYRNELYHYGTKGQKWGIRNYQNEDGSYTAKGKAENNGHGRYSDASSDISNRKLKDFTKARNIAIGVAAVAAIGVGSYLAYDLMSNKDFVISGSETLQRITGLQEEELNDVFYAAQGKHDKERYAKLFPEHMHRAYKEDEYLVKELLLSKDIKVANNKTASSVFKDLMKNDSEYAEDVKNAVQSLNLMQRGKDLNALRALLGNVTYDEFNKDLVYINQSYPEAAEKFYSKLKDMGYSALVDVNDQKFSGYNASAPLIVFDKDPISIGNVETKSFDRLGSYLEMAKANGEVLAEKYMPTIGVLSIAAGTASAVDSQKNIKTIKKQQGGTKK